MLVLLLFSIIPREDVVRESCDLAEHNFFYDEHGRLVFEQIIYYDWSWDDERYQVRAWRLLKRPEQLLHRDWENGGHAAMWFDGDCLRQIRAAHTRETWLQQDPELVEREFLPKERRRELRSVKVKK